MTIPQIDFIPVRPAVCFDSAVDLDVLVRITSPVPESLSERPALNLGLVLDRSGSMAALKKMDYAIRAAVFAVEQLLPTDRVSVTVFDDQIQTLVPSTLATDRQRIINVLRGVRPGNTTALFDGWQEGAKQVRSHLTPGGLNRVLLLSDGLANVGETNTDVIATGVHRLTKEGVGTTTMGVGDDYNEDLLEAMAQSGDGSYFYIESPAQLPDIFQTELHGLRATHGHRASLGIEPQGGVEVADVLNDLERTPAGRLKLPNLVAGLPVLVLLRLAVPPVPQADEQRPTELCRFRLAWDQTGREGRQRHTVALHLPVVSRESWGALPVNAEVQERVALLRAARLKKEANDLLARGDRTAAQGQLDQCRHLLAEAPQTVEMTEEIRSLEEIEAHLRDGADEKFAKRAKYEARQRRQSKPYW
ncbi:MAG: VWA domain-containing protein [Gemmataceae bacterium]|nr:VWA domain-containing protein [Gemmataceae bacterium]